MEAESRVNGQVIAVVCLALLGLLTAARMTTTSAEHRKEEALASLLEEAQQAAAAHRDEDAARAFRRALQLDSGSFPARIGLARVLVRMKQWTEAQGHLSQLRNTDPASSQVNLLSARAAWQEGQLELASDYFHRAVYGYWPPGEMEERSHARMLMVRLLDQRQDRGALVPELLRLQRELPQNSPYRRETALLMLKSGMAEEAARELRSLLRQQASDVDLQLALAQAELAMGNYLTARTQLRSILRQNPKEERAATQLEMVERVLALDPLARRLSLVERHRRSRALLEAVLSRAESCGALSTIAELLEPARREAAEPYQRSSAETNLERNIQSAERLWSLLPPPCHSGGDGSDPLFHVFARLEREAQ